MVIGLDYISNSPSLAKINQQNRCGRGEIALKCHYLLSAELSEQVAEALNSSAVQDLLNVPSFGHKSANVSSLFAFPFSLSSGSAAARGPADVCLCHCRYHREVRWRRKFSPSVKQVVIKSLNNQQVEK